MTREEQATQIMAGMVSGLLSRMGPGLAGIDATAKYLLGNKKCLVRTAYALVDEIEEQADAVADPECEE